MPPKARLWLFRIFTALAVPLLLLGAVEAGLRLAGVGHPTGFTVPCTAEGRPARCDNDRFTWPFFSPGAFRLPPSFAIPDEKPPGTFRILVVGESAAMGDPDPSFAFSRYLEVMLRERFPGVRFEVVNTAITAVNSHVLLPAVRDLAGRQADLFVFYVGNNEVVGHAGTRTVATPRASSRFLIRAAIWARSTRIGQLLDRLLQGRGKGGAVHEWRGMEQFLASQVRHDDEGLARVRDHLRANLRDMVELARGSGARVIVSTVGTNLRDSAPFASLHRRGLDPADEARWAGHLREGAALEDAGRCGEALPQYALAAAIDDQHAELQFRIARCRLQAGDAAGARAAYARARDLDTLRFRADGPANEITRAVASAAGPGVELLDGEAVLAAGAPDGIPGRELFHEHVHLTPRGNYLLARALYPRVVALLPPEVQRTATGAGPPSQEACDRLLALTGADRRRVAADVLARLGRPPFTNQLDHEAQVRAARREAEASAGSPGEVEAAYREAIARAPRDRWLRFNHAQQLLDRDPAAAAEELRTVLEILPSHYEARERLAIALLKLGRNPEAVAQCRTLLAQMPYNVSAWYSLAYGLARTGSLDEAVAAYERALPLDPARAGWVHNEIGRLRLHQRRPDAAAASFRRAAEAGAGGPDEADALSNLARALRMAARPEEARAALDRAVAAYQAELGRNPGAAAAHYGLAGALAERRDAAGAEAHLRAAAGLDPRDAEARRALLQLLEAQGRTGEALEAARAAERALRDAGQEADAASFGQAARRLEARPAR